MINILQWMILYSKLFNKSRQISRLSIDSYLNFAVLVCTLLFLYDKILINSLILGQVRYKYLVLRSLNLLQMQRKWYSDSTKERTQSLHILSFLSVLFILSISISSLCDDNLNFVIDILEDSLVRLFR